MELKSPQENIAIYCKIMWEPDDLIEIRMLPDGPRKWVKSKDLVAEYPKLLFSNQHRLNIYVGINPRNKEGGKIEDVKLGRVLVADFDNCTPDRALEIIAAAGVPLPTMLVNSGHGAHGIWRLNQFVWDMAMWTRAMKALIARVGSDAAIHDPPRILRLPGLLNVKSEPALPCIVVGAWPERVYSIEQVAGPMASWPAKEAAAGGDVPLPFLADGNLDVMADRFSRLSRATRRYLDVGGSEGERQRGAFLAACDMAGNGIPQAVAEAKIVGAAMGSGLDEGEARQAVRSAYGKSRGPSRPLDSVEVDLDEPKTALMKMYPVEAEAIKAKMAGEEKLPPETVEIPHSTAAKQPFNQDDRTKFKLTDTVTVVKPFKVYNVIDYEFVDKRNEEKQGLHYVPMIDIASTLHKNTGGWPRRAGNILFASNHSPDAMPSMKSITMLDGVDNLFGWMGKYATIRWTGKEATDAETHEKLNPHTKGEFHSYLGGHAEPSYDSIEILPHYPPIKNIYYVPCKFPDIDQDLKKAGPLDELMGEFNPETELDRFLLLSALLTPGWGGPPGCRPLFVFTSPYGKGVGKSATAGVIASVWGGYIEVHEREDWEKTRGRMLCDAGLSKRIYFMDNVKGKVSSADLESMLTSKSIGGWRPYHGEASRPGILTGFLSANSLSVGGDVAPRAIIISIGQQKHQKNFVSWSEQFIDKWKPEIIAKCLAYLARGSPFPILQKNRDRWGDWQDGVIANLDQSNELAELIINRRPEVDSDLDDAEQIAKCIRMIVEGNNRVPFDTSQVFITRQQLYFHLIEGGYIDKNNMSLKASVTWVRERCNNGPLARLKEKKHCGSRGWLLTGKNCKLGTWRILNLDGNEEPADKIED